MGNEFYEKYIISDKYISDFKREWIEVTEDLKKVTAVDRSKILIVEKQK